jgi:hypothetical protein
MQVAKANLSLRERSERWIAATCHTTITGRLQRFREELEREMEPEPWTGLEAPMVLLLSDVCDALALNEDERANILGQRGERALTELLETRVTPRFHGSPRERQAKALTYVQEYGRINISAYRQLCPGLSDETLRLDLVDLARRGVLTKNGAKRGTYYTAVALKPS